MLCRYRRSTDGIDSPACDTLSKLIKRVDIEGKQMILIRDTNRYLKKGRDGNTRKITLINLEFQFEQLIKDFIRISTITNSTDDTSNGSPFFKQTQEFLYCICNKNWYYRP